MNITIVCDVLGSETNGQTLAATNLIKYLSKKHNVKVLCADQDKKNTPNYYVVPNLSLGIFDKIIKKNNVTLAKPKDEIIREALKDAEHVHIMLPFVLGRRALRIAREMGLSTTAGFHCQAENISSHFRLHNSNLFNKAIYKNFYRGFYKYIDGIHYPTQFVRDDFEKNIKCSTNGFVISNGVNTHIKKEFIEKPDNLKDKFVILSTGRYSVEKSQQTLINAIKYSKYKNRIQLILAGQGPLEKKFKRIAKGLPNYPIFKLYNREEMQNVLNICDMYVHPAIAELEGIACLEAICAGKLVIVSDSKRSATKNFAVDKKCIFKHGNAKHLAKVIDYWIEHPEDMKQCADKYCRDSIQYNQDCCMEEMEKMILTINKTKKSKIV